MYVNTYTHVTECAPTKYSQADDLSLLTENDRYDLPFALSHLLVY